MKTAYYTFTTWDGNAMASGFDGAGAGARQAVLIREGERTVRAPGGGNVIDLAAWRAANTAMPEEEPDWTEEERGEPEEPELFIPAPRPRKSRRAAVLAELVSTACVAAVALVIILRVLMF